VWRARIHGGRAHWTHLELPPAPGSELPPMVDLPFNRPSSFGGGIRSSLGYSDNRMVSAARILSGLPPYGPMPTTFPPEWGYLGREGTVVEFKTEEGVWVGNFQPGLGRLQFAGLHPDGLNVIVIAAGDLWIVNPGERTAVRMLPSLEAILEVHYPEGWLFSRQGIAPQGLVRRGSCGTLDDSRGMDSINYRSLKMS